MNKLLVLLLFFLTPFYMLHGQEESQNLTSIDSLYREDQFYLGLSFNLLSDKPAGIRQNGFSGSIQGGFIRDMPINQTRTRALGIGIGLAIDTFNQNLFIGEQLDGETTIFEQIPSDLNEDKNRFSYYSIELPFEYRWRASTPTEYSFWRIHGGVRVGYIYYFKSSFEQPNNAVTQTDIPELNKFQYGLTLSFGYGAFNFQGYYALSTLFNEDAIVRTGAVNLRPIRLGFQFFFL